MLQRAEVGDPQGVGRDRAGAGATAGADPDAVVLGPVDEVGDHQVVAAVALARDDAELHVDPLLDVSRQSLAGVARLDPAPHLLDEPGLLGLAGRHVGAGHVAAGRLGELDVAPLRDEQGVVAGLRHPEPVGPQLAHLGRGLDVVAAAVELEPVGVGQSLAGRDADQGIVGAGVLGVVVVGVVGRDRRDAEVLAEPQQVVTDPLLDVDPVVHQLEEEAVLAEDLLELGGRAAGFVVLPQAQPGLDLARGATGRRDQALGIAVEQVAVGPRLVEEALEARPGREAEQVVHALGRLGPHRHVGVGAAARDVVAALLGHVALAPLDPAALRAVASAG